MKEDYFKILRDRDMLLAAISNQSDFFIQVEDINDPELDEDIQESLESLTEAMEL